MTENFTPEKPALELGLKVYIATSLEAADKHGTVSRMLETMGCTLTYDWTEHGAVHQDAEPEKRMRQVAHAELRGVAGADLVVVLLPGGRGTHTEMGAALMANKPVLLHAEDEDDLLDHTGRPSSFYYHPLVTRVICPLCELSTAIKKAAQWIVDTDPDGFQQVPGVCLVNHQKQKLAVLGWPNDLWPDYDDSDGHPHNCDAMGCGQAHVIAWVDLGLMITEQPIL